MFTERFDEVIFEPLLLIDNLVYLFINLRAKRGGSLFEAGSEREENEGPLRSERCGPKVAEGMVAEQRNSDRKSV